MRVELGNEAPIEIVEGEVRHLDVGLTVTTMEVRHDATYEVAKKGTVTDVSGEGVEVTSARELAGTIAMHLMANAGGQFSHMPGQEAAIEVLRAWPNHSERPPTWVRCDDKNFELLLSHLFQCPIRDDEEAAR